MILPPEMHLDWESSQCSINSEEAEFCGWTRSLNLVRDVDWAGEEMEGVLHRLESKVSQNSKGSVSEKDLLWRLQ